MVTPRTGRPRGRPRYDFLRDPERFAVAFVDALTALGTSETDAFKIAAAQLVGIPVSIETVEPRRKQGRGAIPGGTLVSYDQAAVSIAGKGDSVRRKFKMSCTQEVAAWRVAMGRAFILTLIGTDTAPPEVEELAASVGEADYTKRVLLPMITARFYARRSL
jgi:hypothetical protein